MSRGFYSIVRYSNNLNDQRVNLGVLIWHPTDGCRLRIAPTLGRVHAVNADADLDEIGEQLDHLAKEVASCNKIRSDFLAELASRYREGLEVSKPFPARMYSLSAVSEKLFDMLITPKAESRRPRVQFQQNLRDVIKDVVQNASNSNLHYEELGKQRLNGVTVDLGVQVILDNRKSLWHALALGHSSQSQVAKAKATAMEIVTIRSDMPAYADATQYVAVQAVNLVTSHREAAEEWLRHAKAEVLVVEAPHRLPELVRERIFSH
jgi:hypothetical protein